jgi:hypothetical protein
MRTEHHLVAALKSLQSQAPDPDAVLAAVNRRVARRGPLARFTGRVLGPRHRWAVRKIALPGRTGTARLIAPLGAAAAVAAIAVAGALLATGLRNGQHAGVNAGAGWNTATAPVALGTITPTAGPARFFLAYQREPVKTGIISHFPVAAFSVADGHETGSLAAMNVDFEQGASAMAGTGNDRTFIVSYARGPAKGPECAFTTTLYRLDLTDQGVPSSLTRLSLPRIGGEVTRLAVTPDGRTLAYATTVCHAPLAGVAVLGVMSTVTGQSRQWTWPGPGVAVPSLSISTDGRMIEYLANPNKVLGPYEGQTLDNDNTVGLLPAGSPSGSVTRYASTVLHWTTRPSGSAAVTSDGRNLYYCTPDNANGSGPHSPFLLRRYNVATGVTTKLGTYHYGDGCELAISHGTLLIDLGTDQAGVTRAIRYDLKTGLVTPYPQVAYGRLTN